MRKKTAMTWTPGRFMHLALRVQAAPPLTTTLPSRCQSAHSTWKSTPTTSGRCSSPSQHCDDTLHTMRLTTTNVSCTRTRTSLHANVERLWGELCTVKHGIGSGSVEIYTYGSARGNGSCCRSDRPHSSRWRRESRRVYGYGLDDEGTSIKAEIQAIL